MKPRTLPPIAAACLLLAGPAVASDAGAAEPTLPGQWRPAAGQLRERNFHLEALAGERRRTLFFVPRDFTPEREWPLLVALHGVTASPDEWVGFPRFLELADRHGFVVAMPDSIGFAGDVGERMGVGEALAEYVDSVVEMARDELAATGEQWLIGFSAGGAGVWRHALRDPEAWTGVIAIAPAGTPSDRELEHLDHLRVMVVQGSADTAVYVPRTRRFVRRLADANVRSCSVRLEHAGHRLEAWPVMPMIYGFLTAGRCAWP